MNVRGEIVVQFPRMANDIRIDGRLERVFVQPLQQVRLNPFTCPINLTRRQQRYINTALSGVSQDAREEAQCAATLLEILHSSQTVLSGFQ